MSSSARVDSIDVIKEFRGYLTKFKENANSALGDADSDLNRIQSWLEVEQMTLWSGQIRKRHDILVKAEEALRQKLLYKDSTGSRPSAVDEQKAVTIAKKRLAEAEQKLANVKGWIRRLPKETSLYRGGVSRFSGTVSGGITTAIGQLGATIEMLEKYIGLGPAPAAGGPSDAGAVGAAGGKAGGASMARAEGEAPKEEKFNVAAIRAAVPSKEEMVTAPPLRDMDLPWAKVTDEQRAALKAKVDYPVDAAAKEMIALTRQSLEAKQVFLLNMGETESGAHWCAGEVGGGPANGYNKVSVGDLAAARADFAEFFTMPAKWLAILGPQGLVAVFNASDEKVI